MDLRANPITEFLESFSIKLCPIVYSDSLWPKASPQSIWKNILPPPQHILNYLVLVEVGLANQGSIFATAKWAVLIELETKAASSFLHIFYSLHTFGLALLHPKLPSANKIPVEKLFPAKA
jgi:hypothetical protein